MQHDMIQGKTVKIWVTIGGKILHCSHNDATLDIIDQSLNHTKLAQTGRKFKLESSRSLQHI